MSWVRGSFGTEMVDDEVTEHSDVLKVVGISYRNRTIDVVAGQRDGTFEDETKARTFGKHDIRGLTHREILRLKLRP